MHTYTCIWNDVSVASFSLLHHVFLLVRLIFHCIADLHAMADAAYGEQTTWFPNIHIAMEKWHAEKQEWQALKDEHAKLKVKFAALQETYDNALVHEEHMQETNTRICKADTITCDLHTLKSVGRVATLRRYWK